MPSCVTKKADPFAALDKLRSQLPPGPADEKKLSQTPRGPARAVIRLERKQRGGKEVTVVEKLGLDERTLETWCRELKQALGCGGAVERAAIVLQGDLRQRLPQLLEARGVRQITVSG